jgi:hypothetical protein
MTELEQAAVDLLKRIVAEAAGPGKPYSADSYLPAHLIYDARAVINLAEDQA